MAQGHIATHYDNLKVARNSPPEVIRAAYRALAQKYHPDRYPDQARGTRIMRVINQAYEVLSDPERRREHDAWIAEQEGRIAAESARQAREGTRAGEGGASPTGARTGGASRAGAAGGQFNDSGRFRHDGSNGSPDMKGKAREMRWWWYAIGLMVWPFILAARGLKALLRFALIISVVFLGIAGVLTLLQMTLDSRTAIATSPAPTADAQRQRPLQDHVREKVVDGRKAPTYQDVSRCFFVYAPIAQVGRDYPHAELFQFGQPRVAWIGGYVQGRRSNVEFKRVFEGQVETNKRAGIQIEETLLAALRNQNQSQFKWAVDQAVACDRLLGFKSGPRPRL